MATDQLAGVVSYLRQAALSGDAGPLSDGQLLDCFLARHEEGAFRALMRRHGPMVMGVCRRLLHNAHDAEDAFQATFLILVRKAASIGRRELVGNWLYGVAYRTAREARSRIVKRREKERQAGNMPKPTSSADEVWHDLQAVLDDELSHLPEKYRAPIILCDLEGKTRKQVAKQLDWGRPRPMRLFFRAAL